MISEMIWRIILGKNSFREYDNLYHDNTPPRIGEIVTIESCMADEFMKLDETTNFRIIMVKNQILDNNERNIVIEMVPIRDECEQCTEDGDCYGYTEI